MQPSKELRAVSVTGLDDDHRYIFLPRVFIRWDERPTQRGGH